MSFNYKLVKKQRVNFTQVNKILARSCKTLRTSKVILGQSSEVAFTSAYEAMLGFTLALMFSNGFRPKVQLGHHKTLTSYAEYTLGKPFKELTKIYERMRKKRNKVIYDFADVAPPEAKNAILIAEEYFQVVENKIAKDNPQQKLWKPK